MRFIDHKDRFEHVPEDAKTAIFVCWRHTNRTRYVLEVSEACTDEDNALQRAILIFQEGIRKTEAESIAKKICEFVEETPPSKGKGKKIHKLQDRLPSATHCHT